MDNFDKPLSNVIPQTLLDWINILQRERGDSKFSSKLTGNLKDCSLVIRTVGAKHVAPLKDGQCDSGCQLAGPEDKCTDDLSLQRPKRKRKKKFPTTVAGRGSCQKTEVLETEHICQDFSSERPAATNRGKFTVLEEENSIHTDSEYSSGVCEVVKNPATNRLDSDVQETNNSLDELAVKFFCLESGNVCILLHRTGR